MLTITMVDTNNSRITCTDAEHQAVQALLQYDGPELSVDRLTKALAEMARKATQRSASRLMLDVAGLSIEDQQAVKAEIEKRKKK